MAHVQSYRAGWSRTVAVMTWVFAAGGLVSTALSREDATVLRWAPALVLLAAVGWFVYWRPEVRVDEHGVTISNVARRVVLPWPAVQEIHSRYGLMVETTDGREWPAWAVPSPVGLQRARAEETEAALMVRQRLERVRGRGELAGRSDREPVEVEKDLVAVGALAGLAALTVLAQVLTR